MGEIRITLQPGDSLIVDCNCRSEEPAGPDGHPDEEQNGPEPTPGISLGEFTNIVADHWGIPQEMRNPSNPQWPRDESGQPIPE